MTVAQYMKFDREKAKRFKHAYERAVHDGRDQFAFEGADFLTSYARYVLEYLTSEGVYRHDH